MSRLADLRGPGGAGSPGDAGAVGGLARRVVPRPLRSFLRGRRDDAIVGLRRAAERLGYNVARRGDCYSPLPLQSRLRETAARWNRPSELPGVRYDLDAIERTLAHLLDAWGGEFAALPAASEIKARGMGPGFPGLDALVLYAMLRERKPRRYLEVGSGVSTWYASRAAERNAADGRPLEIRCIEPRPYPGLSRLAGIALEPREVQDVPLARFEALGEDDVLFIDSSHVLKIDGDVPFLFLEVLPRLAPGVLVHVHDVPFPYNVPHPAELWVLGHSWPMFWNEAMVLQAFLAFNDHFEILLSAPLVRHFDERFLAERVPGYQGVAENPDAFSSIWLRRAS